MRRDVGAHRVDNCFGKLPIALPGACSAGFARCHHAGGGTSCSLPDQRDLRRQFE